MQENILLSFVWSWPGSGFSGKRSQSLCRLLCPSFSQTDTFDRRPGSETKRTHTVIQRSPWLSIYLFDRVTRSKYHSPQLVNVGERFLYSSKKMKTRIRLDIMGISNWITVILLSVSAEKVTFSFRACNLVPVPFFWTGVYQTCPEIIKLLPIEYPGI